MTPTTAEWVSKAEGDYDAVRILRRSRKRSRYDAICFHCQQCAEKYLKAKLVEAGLPVQKTHDLVLLLKQARVVEPLWQVMQLRLSRLNSFAVAVRYPGRSADSRSASECFTTCERMRTLARASLGL